MRHKNQEDRMRRALVAYAWWLVGLFLCLASVSGAQEITSLRIFDVSYTTYAPTQLQINRGRLLWRETDNTLEAYSLELYTGGQIVKLDSSLQGVQACLDGDLAAWNSSDGMLHLYDVRRLTSIGTRPSYIPDYDQPVSVSNGAIVYATPREGSGTVIELYEPATGHDTMFSAGIWNTEPTIHHGQVAWVAGDSGARESPSNIFFFDGNTTRNISPSTGVLNTKPILRDGEVAWLQIDTEGTAIRLFTGDSVVTLAGPAGSPQQVVGFDLSDGTAVWAVTDSLTGVSTIGTYFVESGTRSALVDSGGVYALHIDDQMLVWQSGTGPDRKVRSLRLPGGAIRDVTSGENPVVDDEEFAWTYGDAVEMAIPVTYQKLTTDNNSGWQQSRYKPIDRGSLVWQNFDGSLNGRVFSWNGTNAAEVKDSLTDKDFFMANDGGAVWRENSDSLFLYDWSSPPRKVVDSLQCENLYLADGSIGFNGFRLDAGNNINQAWIYRIGTGEIIQLTEDTSPDVNNSFVVVDGPGACWHRDSGNVAFNLMYFDGQSIMRLSDSTVGFKFSFRRGKIVWTEVRSGIQQVMMYDVQTGATSQLSSGTHDADQPVTDGTHVAWLERGEAGSRLKYLDLASGTVSEVADYSAPLFDPRWPWLSDGRYVWTMNDNVYLYDGTAITQLTGAGPYPPQTEPYVDSGYVVWKADNLNESLPRYGDIFRGKLRPLVDFDADGIAGPAPLSVRFFDRSWYGSTAPAWDFGDGTSSNSTNPVHTYAAPGVYSVSLTVTSPAGSATERKVRLVHADGSTAVTSPQNTAPGSFELFQNYPNPFNPKTEIRYQVSEVSNMKLRVYDLLGRVVATLVSEVKRPGTYEVDFDASSLASGVYFCRLVAQPVTGGPGFVKTAKMILVK